MTRSFFSPIVAGILVLVLASGCGAGSEAGTSLANFDTRIPDNIARHVPLPEGANVRMSMIQDERMIVMFSPGVSWPETLSFMSENLPAHGWAIEREDLPERTEGEREARWVARGHGHEMTVSITAFGGEQGFNMTGHMMLEEDA
jgi:hypothetical protein